jgi:hypothetical protein
MGDGRAASTAFYCESYAGCGSLSATAIAPTRMLTRILRPSAQSPRWRCCNVEVGEKDNLAALFSANEIDSHWPMIRRAGLILSIKASR